MKNRLVLFLFICLLPVFNCMAQEEAGQLVVPLEKSGFVAFKVETVPTGPQQNASGQLDARSLINPQVMVDENHVIHRVLTDSDGDFVFGYDLVVESLSELKQFKVVVRPLSKEFEQQLRARTKELAQNARPVINVSTLPRSTEAQTIDDGDAFALDLLVNPQTGMKIVDMVQVSFDRAKLWQSPGPARSPARDFTLANVELAIRDYKLLVNGELIAGGRPTRGCEGALVWFYVPGKGRFIFSLIPHRDYDFRKIGLIEDNRISFSLGGDQYEWISSEPILGSGGHWNLWVLPDPGYIPIPEFFPPAQAEKAARNEGGIRQVIGHLFEGRLLPMRDNNQSEQHPTRSGPNSKSTSLPARVRVTIGAADRIENLWPK